MNEDATSLSHLHDVIVPPEISWWPPAPGWLWMLVALAVILVLVLLRTLTALRNNRYRREALAELADCENDLPRMAEILKRTALAAFPRSQVASLTGQAWLTFLDHTGRTNYFATQDWLVEALYNPGGSSPSPDTVNAFRQKAHDWIRNHHAVEEQA